MHKNEMLAHRYNSSGELIVTELRQGVKNPERVNVFVSGKFEFSLDVAQVVDLGVRVGTVLSSEELGELKRASEFGKLYQRALEKALSRPHSERELRDYLNRKVFEKKLDKKYIDEIIGRLIDRGYLNDRRFAEWYVENRFVKKGVSRRRLNMELSKKGVAKEIIDETLSTSERDDAGEILKIITRKRARYDDEKLLAYLCRQGFSFDLSRELIQSYGKD